MARKTIIQLFEESVKKYANNPFMLEKTDDTYQPASYSDIRGEVTRFAAGLMSMGVQKGDRIALLSEGRNDWVISELGILYAGAVNVPLSVKLAEPEEIKFRLEHSGSVMLIVSGHQHKKIGGMRKNIKALKQVICLDSIENAGKGESTKEALCKLGDEFLDKKFKEFEERWSGVEGDDLANICYTSGTTADPKGIMLTHGNYTANVEQARGLMPVPEWYTTLLILPWDHSFAHTAGIYTIMSAGASAASVQVGSTGLETLKNIPVNIKEIKPVFLLSVPALAKNFRKNIERSIREKGPKVEKLFNRTLKLAYDYNGLGIDRGKGWKKLKWPLLKFYDMLIFSKIRQGFGGKLKFFIGGGALLDIELQRFFYAIGIPMFQGYGLTEASPIISSNSEERHKLGTSGYLVSDLDLRILDDDGNELPAGEKGEIVVRGENVMKGYWKNEEATKDTIRDGWLHTGDLGYMDEDGFLNVLGRFKSLLISDDGEKFSPESIEEAFTMKLSTVDQCMLHNDQHPYTICLLVPNIEGVKRALKERNVDPNSEQTPTEALGIIEEEMARFRKGGPFEDMFPHRWLPSATAILPEAFTEENHMLNSTLKMVRGKITEQYDDVIERLYQPANKDIRHQENMDTIKKLLI